MPKIKKPLEEAFGPPAFPLGGRLPTEVSVVGANYRRQAAEESLFCRQRDFAGKSQRFVCCHSMHVSLFFDGTNNNDNNDTKKNRPSNIAKLYHASIQDDEAKGSGYYSYYMPKEDLAERLERTTAMLRAAGSLFEINGEVA